MNERGIDQLRTKLRQAELQIKKHKLELERLRERIDQRSGASNPVTVFQAGGSVGVSGTLSAGAGLTGGGSFPGSVSVAVGQGNGITVNANDVALGFDGLSVRTIADGDHLAFYDASVTTHSKITFSNFEATLEHDKLSGFDPNEHIDHTTVTITAGVGLSGGGDISANRTLNLDINGLAADGIAAADTLAFYDNDGGDHNKIAFSDFESALNHDNLTGFVPNEHIDHTSVTLTAGDGLTGGGDISANRTFAVGAGDGITVNANDVAVDESYAFTWSSKHTFQAGFDVTGGDAFLDGSVTLLFDNLDPVQAQGIVVGQYSDGGLRVQLDTSQTSGEPIFTVLSTGGNERLRVEHDGFVSTTNDLYVGGTSDSYFAGNLGVGDASPARKLEVLDTSTQVRISYDASNYGEIEIDSSGHATIYTTGAITRLSNSQARLYWSNIGGGSADSGAQYEDSGGSARYWLIFDSNTVIFANRAASGSLQFRANNAAGSGGENTVAQFDYNVLEFYEPGDFQEGSRTYSTAYGTVYYNVHARDLDVTTNTNHFVVTGEVEVCASTGGSTKRHAIHGALVNSAASNWYAAGGLGSQSDADGDNIAGVWGEQQGSVGGYTLWAGYFGQNVYIGEYIEMPEISAPSAPSANRVRIYAADNGGKTTLYALFSSGAAQAIAAQP